MKSLLLLLLLGVVLTRLADVSLSGRQVLECLTSSLFTAPKIGNSVERAAGPLTAAGAEQRLAQTLRELISELQADGYLENARVSLKQVRYVRSGQTTQASNIGFYQATLHYDWLSPLSRSAGMVLLTSVCSTGVSQVVLSDEQGNGEKFSCQQDV